MSVNLTLITNLAEIIKKNQEDFLDLFKAKVSTMIPEYPLNQQQLEYGKRYVMNVVLGIHEPMKKGEVL